MRRPGRWWRGKSTPAKVETYTRWSFHFFAATGITLFGLPMLGEVAMPAAACLAALLCGHMLLCAVTGSRALDWHRGLRGQPVRLMGALGAVSAVLACGGLVLGPRVPGGQDAENAVTTAFVGALVFGVGVISLGIRGRRRVMYLAAGCGAGAALAVFVLRGSVASALVAGVGVLAGTAFFAFTSVLSVWLLNAVYALDAARETRARLAVAEERLRFGRDLHDVMGRNLAVIALKSELAVQLAQRGRPEAVTQMVEVQRLARESQREVREVVRGYREADLGSELAGARGVLAAAGIACAVRGPVPALPPAAQSALGWVVREAATNVLRHGDARRCEVRLAVRTAADGGRSVVLEVENDGVSGTDAKADGAGEDRADGAGGSPRAGGIGLRGLRERLAEIGGTLNAGATGDGLFRLVAEVPVTAGTVGMAGTTGNADGAGGGAVDGAGGGPGTGGRWAGEDEGVGDGPRGITGEGS